MDNLLWSAQPFMSWEKQISGNKTLMMTTQCGCFDLSRSLFGQWQNQSDVEHIPSLYWHLYWPTASLPESSYCFLSTTKVGGGDQLTQRDLSPLENVRMGRRISWFAQYAVKWKKIVPTPEWYSRICVIKLEELALNYEGVYWEGFHFQVLLMFWMMHNPTNL